MKPVFGPEENKTEEVKHSQSAETLGNTGKVGPFGFRQRGRTFVFLPAAAGVLAPCLPAFRAAAGGRYSLSAREDRSTDTDDRACVQVYCAARQRRQHEDPHKCFSGHGETIEPTNTSICRQIFPCYKRSAYEPRESNSIQGGSSLHLTRVVNKPMRP